MPIVRFDRTESRGLEDAALDATYQKVRANIEARKMVADYLVSEMTAKYKDTLADQLKNPGQVALSIHWG